MPHHHFTPTDIKAKLDLAHRLEAEGRSTAHICRRLEVNELTYLRWEKKYGGLGASAINRLRALEEENAQLRAALDRVDEALSGLRSASRDGLRALPAV